MTFKDHFSERAESYAAFRPAYPDTLIDSIARLPARRRLALDCGTGSGQAAVALAARFERVIATDASDKQIQHAMRAPNVDYCRAPAEASGLANGSVDLVTAAQSLHWFDIGAFFREVRRVLANGGAVAVWGYGDPVMDDPVLQSTLHNFNRGTLETYWPAERSILLGGYRDMDFPFDEVAMPALSLEVRWTLNRLLGLLRTWSSVSRYSARHGIDPVSAVESPLARAWGRPGRPRLIRWPLYIRAGRI